MRIARLIAAPVVALAALVSLTGCGESDAKIGDTATITSMVVGSNKATYSVKVVSVTEAPADIAAQYESTDKIYFVQTEAKLVDNGGGAIPHLMGISGNVAAKLEDGTFVQTSFTGIGHACESALSPTEREAALAAGNTVTECVPISGKGGKKVVGVYVGPTDLEDGGSKVWALA